ncbi:MAG: response regulator transcription factor [Solirubrobacteraceae bacterium]
MGGTARGEPSDGSSSPGFGVEPSDEGPHARGDEPAGPPIGVVVADDSYMIREFLASALGRAPQVRLLAACSDAKELQQAIDDWAPEVVVTDIRMPPSGDEGLRVANRLRVSHPGVGVVVLSQYAEPAYALSLLGDGTGGRAYLLKERVRDKQELIGAIEAVARGGSVIDPRIVDVLIAARMRAANSRVARLTPREQQLLAEIAAGKSNGAIAESLVLTKRAVEKHVNAIFSKLDLPESPDVSRRVRAALIFLAEEGIREEP